MPVAQRTITYDAASRITQIGDGPSHNQTFTYDADSRLLTFSGFTSALASETRAYAYDANGNRTSATVNGAPATYSYTPNTNRLTSVSGLYTNNYDAAGNLTSDGRLTYTYDARGRLVQIVTPGDSGNAYLWTYSGLGQPTSRQDGADDSGHGYGVVWVYDQVGHMLGEYTYPGGAAVQEFIWLGDTLVGVAGNIPVYCYTPPCTAYGVGYVWSDHLNAPRAITNVAGAQVWQWDSAPFGDTLPSQNPAGLGVFNVNHRFPGQYADSVTQINQNGARIYSPALGRYIQSDSAGLAAGTNTYVYVNGDPVDAVDPPGLGTTFVNVSGGAMATGSLGVYYNSSGDLGYFNQRSATQAGYNAGVVGTVGYLFDGHDLNNKSVSTIINFARWSVTLIFDTEGLAGTSLGWGLGWSSLVVVTLDNTQTTSVVPFILANMYECTINGAANSTGNANLVGALTGTSSTPLITPPITSPNPFTDVIIVNPPTTTPPPPPPPPPPPKEPEPDKDGE